MVRHRRNATDNMPVRPAEFFCCRDRGKSTGFTYIGVLIFVALMGIALASVGKVWSTQKIRENEREILFIGDQYRHAIGQYYERSQGAKQFPKTMDELLLDRRYPTVQRYLRRPYVDPLTGKPEWGLVMRADGGIVGVYSLSEESPLKRSNFHIGYENFVGADRYSDWKFIYVPIAENTPPTGAVNRTR